MNKKLMRNIIFIFIAALLAMLPKLIDGIFNLGADGMFHANLVYGYREAFLDNNFAPNGVLPIIGKDLGYGTPLFYPTLIHYLTGLISLLIPGDNPVFTAMDIMYFLNFFLSGISIYLLAQALFKNNWVSLFSAVIYIFIPYHLTQVYVLDSFGQIWLFVFFPLVFLGIYYLCIKDYHHFYIYFIIGMVGCLYVHMLTTFFAALIASVIVLIFYYKAIFNKQALLHLLKAALIIFGLAAPLIFNLIYLKYFHNYLVFSKDHMKQVGMINTFVRPINYLIHDAHLLNYLLDVSIDFLVVIMALVSIAKLRFYKNKKLVIFLATASVYMMIMMSTYSPLQLIANHIEILQNITRVSPLLYLAISLLAPLCIMLIPHNYRFFKYILLIMCMVCGMSHIRYLQDDNEKDGTLYWLTSNKEQVYKNASRLANGDQDILLDPVNLSLGAEREYLTQGFNYENYDFKQRRDENIKILVGNPHTNIKILAEDVPVMEFVISDASPNSVLELPRFYYPGYRLLTDNPHPVYLLKSDNGYITLSGDDINGSYKLIYKGPISLRIGRIIRFLTILILLGIILYKRLKNKFL